MRAPLLVVLAIVAAVFGAPPPMSVRAAEPARGAAEIAQPSLGETPIIVAFAGFGGVAVIGTRLVVLRRRRRSQEEIRATAAAAAGTSAALERRAIRRAKVRLADDPVVSALGIPARSGPRTTRARPMQAVGPPGARRDEPG